MKVGLHVIFSVAIDCWRGKSHVMADNARLLQPGAVTAEDSMGRGSLMKGGLGMLVVVIVWIYHDRKRVH